MSTPRDKIVTDFARWTALSSTRSGCPIKSRRDVYGLLDKIDFSPLFVVDKGPISDVKFNDWHKSTVDEMCRVQPKLNVIWATKIVNVYLKTRCYVSGYGREGLIDVIHPPFDNGLINGLSKQPILSEHFKCNKIKKMGDIRTYSQYKEVIQACRDLAAKKGFSLFEVEQFWEGTNY